MVDPFLTQSREKISQIRIFQVTSLQEKSATATRGVEKKQKEEIPGIQAYQEVHYGYSDSEE